jgi:glycosyltransferase involved in cell wall biosynthesis
VTEPTQSLPPSARLPHLVEAHTAIVHDWFQGYHGSERVVDVMRTGLFAPANAPDVYTFHAARALLPAELAASIVRESRLARLPGIRQRGFEAGRWRYLLPLMPRYFDRLQLEDYELVISSAHAFAANVRTRPETLHVCYCHTPIRYVWLPEAERGRANGIAGVGLRLLRQHFRRIDLAASRRPDAYVANSSAVARRIEEFYGRRAAVVPPPVDVDKFSPHEYKEPGQFLWVNRLVSYKRPELVVEAFRELPYRLAMVGVGPLAASLRSTLPENVELLGWLPRDELAHRFERAAGFIHVAEEDFGISMVEALAAGTPVIALMRGGALDIVRPNVDGILVDRADVEHVRAAVREMAARRWDPAALAARAATFSRAKFLRRLSDLIHELRNTS